MEDGKTVDLEGDDPILLARLVCLDNGALACPFPFNARSPSPSSPGSTLPKVGLKAVRDCPFGLGGNRISLLLPSLFLPLPPADNGETLSIGDLKDSPCFPRFLSARCLASAAAAAASSAAAKSSAAGIAFHLGFSRRQFHSTRGDLLVVVDSS